MDWLLERLADLINVIPAEWLNFLTDGQLLTAILLYFCLFVPIEMIIHELGHYCWQRRLRLDVKFFRIGIGKLWQKQLPNGTYFILGIPIIGAESRTVGEIDERVQEENNPRAFYYLHRHPRERLIISLFGPLLTLAVAGLIAAAYYLQSVWFGFSIPTILILCLIFVIINELSNLFIPIRILPINIYLFFPFPPWKIKLFQLPDTATDGWLIIQSLKDWVFYKKAAK